MANIEELQRALRQGSDAKARLSGLDEQYQQAQDRGVATTKKDQYGQVSPLSVMADVVGQSRSRRDMRELAPQREAARSNIAQHENAQGLFNAVRQQEQDNQIQANWTDGHALKLAQQSQNEAREVSRQKELGAKLDLESQVGEPTTVWDIETGARQDVTFDPQGNPFTLTTRGLKEPFDMTGFSITKPEKKDKTKLSAAAEKKYLEGKEGEPTRKAAIEKATRMLTAFKSGADSGTSRGLAGLGGGQWTDQAAFDEELDALAELAARARLKAMGEVRPTDPDVKGVKESLFGRWKGENVNINLLTEYLQEQIDSENAVRKIDGREPVLMPETKELEGDWYGQLFEQNNVKPKTAKRTGVDGNGVKVTEWSDGSITPTEAP